MPPGPLKYEGWQQLTRKYPDQEVIKGIRGICEFRAEIGYEGERPPITIYQNLETALNNPQIVSSDIANEIQKNRLESYFNYDSLPPHFSASLLGITDKPDVSKREIYHLSYPTNTKMSINSGIPEAYGTITHCRIRHATLAIRKFGKGCLLIKRDFESTFRHIPIALADILLLGFEWRGKY